jgi:hypothetical protein
MKEISLHILDIIQNSIAAKANRIEVSISEDDIADQISIGISDNGIGIDSGIIKKIVDPYFTSRTTRKVGMGLSLINEAAERCGGLLAIESKPGTGTKIKIIMKKSHIDRQPLGDIAGVMALMVSSNPLIDFIYKHHAKGGEYIFDSKEIKQVLGDVSIADPKVNKFCKEMIQENLKEINASK